MKIDECHEMNTKGPLNVSRKRKLWTFSTERRPDACRKYRVKREHFQEGMFLVD